jgi:hypothetical protein
MSRILEFQPSDEQSIVARVLLELHQAIDANFPEANQASRQFTKTVLTSQNETTRTNTIEDRTQSRSTPPTADKTPKSLPLPPLSMTPKSTLRTPDAPLQTDDIRALMGESFSSRVLTKVLWGLLLCGVFTFAYLYFSANNISISSIFPTD